METTLGKLVEAEQSLIRWSQILEGKAAYHISRLLSLVQEETAQFHKQRDALIQKLGTEREATTLELAQGTPSRVFEVKKENLEEFKKQMEELTSIPITLNKWLLPYEMIIESKIKGADIHLLRVAHLLVNEPE